MTKRETSKPQVYQFRVFIQKISPSIWRRVHLRDDQTLAVFHDALQIVFGWSDEFLHRFQFRGCIYTVPRAFGTAYTKSAEEVTIRELNLRPRERFLYEYNFIDWWQVQIRLEKILPFDDTRSYPFCLDGSQAGPLEDCGGPNAYLHLRTHTYHPLFLIMRFQDLADEYPDDREYGQKIRELYPDIAYWLKVYHFDRDAANQQLRQLSFPL